MAEYPSVIPRHIGIIMDGNGRWAEQRKKPRTFGHKNGISAAKRIIKAAIELGIDYITLYTFSTENWSRPQKEVNYLMRLLKHHMRSEAGFYHSNHIRVRHAGAMEGLPSDVQQEIVKVQASTSDYDAITAVLAINYGGRDEIVRAFDRWRAAAGPDAGRCTMDSLAAYLDNPDVPDPDLIIRTAGEMRLSNFLLWESAYAEFYYSSKLWPEWDYEDLLEAVQHYSNRKRKFGGIG